MKCLKFTRKEPIIVFSPQVISIQGQNQTENILYKICHLQIFLENGSCIQFDTAHTVGICCFAYDLQCIPNGYGKWFYNKWYKKKKILTERFFPFSFSFIHIFQAIKHPDLNFYMVLMSLLVSSANLYLYCYYGNRSTNDYAKMANYLYTSNWYQLPIELQKYFKMMIANAQRPLFYHGFRIVQLNLETYLKVK